MTVYADVLVFVNTIIDYLIISVTCKLVGKKIKEWRKISASFFAGLTSLYIFVPKQNIIAELLIRLLFVAGIVLICFGYVKIKVFLRNVLVLFGVTMLYCGLMVAFWTVFKPNGMVINNSVVYFNISIAEMLIFTVICYLLIRLAKFITVKNAPKSKRCSVCFKNGDTSTYATAILDTGNSLKDVYGDRKVFIVSPSLIKSIYGEKIGKATLLLPYKTVNSHGFIKAYPCDSATVDNRFFDKVLVAVNSFEFDDDYSVIIGTDGMED